VFDATYTKLALCADRTANSQAICFDLADRGLMSPRAFLEKQLIAAVGEDATVEGVRVRDVYFGPQMEEVE
jgi:hypothetical protein